MVFVQHALRFARGEIAHRVDNEARRLLAFGPPWQHLQEQGVAGVTRAHARDETAGHAQRKAGVPGGQLASEMAKPKQIEQFVAVGD
ncbi:hypothetical protein GCM10027066_27170 [Dyella jejuensis]